MGILNGSRSSPLALFALPLVFVLPLFAQTPDASEPGELLTRILYQRSKRGESKACFRLGMGHLSGMLYAREFLKNEKEGVALLRQSAESGFAPAMRELANCYFVGQGVPKDTAIYWKWMREAANLGDPGGQYELGLASYLLEDRNVGINWLRKAESQGHLDAYRFRISLQMSTDKGESTDRLFEAASAGDSDAQYALGTRLLTEKDSDFRGRSELMDGAYWLRRAAQTGNPAASYELGHYYLTGGSGRINSKAGIFWMRKAAESGLTVAQSTLGEVYCTGKLGIHSICDRDIVEGINWLCRAAAGGDDFSEQLAELTIVSCLRQTGALDSFAKEPLLETGIGPRVVFELCRCESLAGNAAAQRRLAVLYFSGTGIAKDEQEGMRWLRKAALQNDAYAQYHLGKAYIAGKLVACDREFGLQQIRKAAESDFAEAQLFLGNLHIWGLYVKQDATTGFYWLKKAARNGVTKAYQVLGGYCAAKPDSDKPQAYAWFSLGAEAGDLECAKLRAVLEATLTKESIETGNRLAEEWRQSELQVQNER